MTMHAQSQASAPEAATPPRTWPRPTGALQDGEPVTIIDRKARQFLHFLAPGARFHLTGGFVDADEVIGAQPGVRVLTSRGDTVAIYRTTLEEYMVLMTRAAQIVVPKDAGFILQWADIFPGAQVAEGGLGSGSLTLALLRAVGESGRVTAFELREDHANRGYKNIVRWPEPLEERLEVRIGDIHQRVGELVALDRVILDLPEPWDALPGAAVALKPGGLVIAYTPTIRQIDTFVTTVLDHREFAEPEVSEVLVRPWVADRTRLRPAQRIVGHTGFIARARRRGPRAPSSPAVDPKSLSSA